MDDMNRKINPDMQRLSQRCDTMAHLMRGKWLTAASMNTSQMKELDSLLQQLETILITPEPTSFVRSFQAFQLCQTPTFEPALWLPESPKLTKGPAPPTMATMATTATTATTATHIESKSATATATFELKDTIQPGVTAPKTLQPVVSSSKPVVSPKLKVQHVTTRGDFYLLMQIQACYYRDRCYKPYCMRIHGQFDPHQEAEFKKNSLAKYKKWGEVACRNELLTGRCPMTQSNKLCKYRHFVHNTVRHLRSEQIQGLNCSCYFNALRAKKASAVSASALAHTPNS